MASRVERYCPIAAPEQVSMAQCPFRRLLVLPLVTVALVMGSPALPVAAAALPRRMAALGDSITRGFNACGWYVDCTSRSWASGSEAGVRSHYLRLRAHNRSLVVYNNAVRGARADSLEGQARSAVGQRADYVTVLIGANDACTSSERTMTPVGAFENRFRAAINILHQGLPHALVYVSSIPDVKRLWEVGRHDAATRFSWTLFGVCRSMLFKPDSMAAADAARRDRVRRRIIGFNQVLAAVCAENPRCRFDGNAVFSYPFGLSQVSRWDHFHPNANGQAVLARLTYRSGFWSRPPRATRHVRFA
ncbi:MAG TPA: GDSL-type esterase/lipase family protein [Actinomadura sp.]|nr:GDSL-type esterase/lipase family protein [Actinomadura sp.]